MSTERLTLTVVIDTGDKGVAGLAGLEPRTIAPELRLWLALRALGSTTVGPVTATISADTGDGTLAAQALVLERAERAADRIRERQARDDAGRARRTALEVAMARRVLAARPS